MKKMLFFPYIVLIFCFYYVLNGTHMSSALRVWFFGNCQKVFLTLVIWLTKLHFTIGVTIIKYYHSEPLLSYSLKSFALYYMVNDLRIRG